MKAVYVGGTCEFCEYIMNSTLYSWKDTNLVKGRIYTVVRIKSVSIGNLSGQGYGLAEYPNPGWFHCSCGFREIEGDAEEWKKIIHKHKPKVKELEPA